MLVFKKNIYFTPLKNSNLFTKSFNENETEYRINAFKLFKHILSSEQKLIAELKNILAKDSSNKINIVYPHASQFGTLDIIESISKNLWKGFLDDRTWYSINSYHFCYLYDSLLGFVEEYSYEDTDVRKKLLPELEGNPINFNQFLNEYFFNTAFLIAAERYNKITPQEKRLLGKVDHALFGAVPPNEPLSIESDPCLEKVINRKPPIATEITLTPLTGSPY